MVSVCLAAPLVVLSIWVIPLWFGSGCNRLKPAGRLNNDPTELQGHSLDATEGIFVGSISESVLPSGDCLEPADLQRRGLVCADEHGGDRR